MAATAADTVLQRRAHAWHRAAGGSGCCCLCELPKQAQPGVLHITICNWCACSGVQVGAALAVDLSAEESACSGAALEVAVDARGRLCGATMRARNAPLHPSSLQVALLPCNAQGLPGFCVKVDADVPDKSAWQIFVSLGFAAIPKQLVTGSVM